MASALQMQDAGAFPSALVAQALSGAVQGAPPLSLSIPPTSVRQVTLLYHRTYWHFGWARISAQALAVVAGVGGAACCVAALLCRKWQGRAAREARNKRAQAQLREAHAALLVRSRYTLRHLQSPARTGSSVTFQEESEEGGGGTPRKAPLAESGLSRAQARHDPQQQRRGGKALKGGWSSDSSDAGAPPIQVSRIARLNARAALRARVSAESDSGSSGSAGLVSNPRNATISDLSEREEERADG